MNKIVFLTGLLTALLFIGTTHGGPFNRQASDPEHLRALAHRQLEQLQAALIQDQNAQVMETIDDKGNEMADAQIDLLNFVPPFTAGSTIYLVSKIGCRAAHDYCEGFDENNDVVGRKGFKTGCKFLRYFC